MTKVFSASSPKKTHLVSVIPNVTNNESAL